MGSKGIPSRGGTERVVEALATRQAVRHRVVVVGSLATCASGDYRGVHVVSLPVPSGKYLRPLALQMLSAVWVLQSDCDVVNVHGMENAFITPLMLLRCPVVVTSHGRAYRVQKWGAVAKLAMRASEWIAMRTATRVTAVSAPQAQNLTRRYRRSVDPIPNGVTVADDADESGARVLLSSVGLEGGRYWLFAAARVDPIKGCHTLIEAWRAVPGAPPLLVVGDLWHASGYEERLRRLAEGTAVHFLPKVDSPTLLAGLLRLAELFVFPSTTEAMSMMLLEALMSGTPVVASDIPENVAILPESVTTFRNGDATDLREKLVTFAGRDRDETRRLAREAAQEVEARFDWGNIALAYEQEYQRAMRARWRSSGSAQSADYPGAPPRSALGSARPAANVRLDSPPPAKHGVASVANVWGLLSREQ